ncbi:purine-nucleoside phosphorylase [Flavicella sediminum]|uniref:purine-nucleoside phosphorylase n=1 Tax=Flavicella sediminum TaxID=2585141 RepID=UPI00111F3B35|nr:purine-nucleoside phosphorylase [Flavicella sediminum]
MIEKIKETVAFLRSKNITEPIVGIVLGTGLGQLAGHIKTEVSIDYADIPNFPLATVESHSGKLIYGELGSKKVLALQGRFHLYEGYNFSEITFPIRILKELGVQNLLISNAAGAINLNYTKGDLFLIDDHINLQGGSPLAEKGIEKLGPRFVDMSAPYSKELNTKLKEIAATKNITLNEGVYAAVVGPQLETRAEYRYLKIIGADAVGMSTVPEVIVANQLELPCVAISVLTDACDPDNLLPINIPEIMELAGKAEPKLNILFTELIKSL